MARMSGSRALVAELDGSYSGVVGLPVFETAELLAEVGVTTVDEPATALAPEFQAAPAPAAPAMAEVPAVAEVETSEIEEPAAEEPGVEEPAAGEPAAEEDDDDEEMEAPAEQATAEAWAGRALNGPAEVFRALRTWKDKDYD